ncbi:hypothetical protein CVT26_005611 [Gymnopilus dilepis]|uniref:Hydrophobin n=1 Tax=Gymnopilus dilepis TaxID=231916 RepID=A0A409XZL9_9AGAR|nr:hypothetical protein CVT26_005611 [Gymnopilus dilepis]
MFARASSLLVLALPLLAAASALPRNDGNDCTTGSLECCASTADADSTEGNILLGLIDVVVGTVQGLIGANCSPITGIGASGTSCNEQPVCCTGNSFDTGFPFNLVVVGCSPININV